MSSPHATRRLAQRAVALLLAMVVTPLVVALGTLDEDQEIIAGRPSPRTVLAPEPVRVVDRDATEANRRIAAQSVQPVRVTDQAARTAIVDDVRSVFSKVREARQPQILPAPEPTEGVAVSPPQTGTLPVEDQVAWLLGEVDLLVAVGLEAMVDLPLGLLDVLERETVAVAQQLARQSFTTDEVATQVAELLSTELDVRTWPGDTATLVVEPLIRAVARPTEQIDPDATDAAQQRAREAEPEVVVIFAAGDPIVVAGEEVGRLSMEALERLGLEGSGPVRRFLQAFGAMALVVAVAAVFLWRMQPAVWRSARKVLLLGTVTVGYAAVVSGISLLTGGDQMGWWYTVPAAALAMLVTILISPSVGVVSLLPAVVLVLLAAPVAPGLAVYVVSSALLSVPLVTRLTSRGDLRSATLRAGLALPLIATVSVAVFGPRDQLAVAVGAAALSGLATMLIVQGVLPFLETMFRLPTATALLDLSDRNHVLLRELEAKAIGTYNHSVMVASLVERACREVGANALLGSVAALYHDIGKVRRPHFFIENQYGIANPHDELDPEVSAQIIHEHVIDGVKMAHEHGLPPEVIAAIASHHGTTLVSFFYDKACRQAGGCEHVEEEHFRYKGTKPKSKEAAILVIADCSEATTRSMAMHRGTLPREEIEVTVDKLLKERLDDHQFDECDLTFDELRRVRDSVVEALVGVYHPRIAYPSNPRPATGTGSTGNGATAADKGDEADEDPESDVTDGKVVERAGA